MLFKKDLITRLKFFLYYSIFWLIFFVAVRILFLVYQFENSGDFDLIRLLATFYHGFKLDLSATAYLLAMPFLVMAFGAFFRGKWYYIFINFYTIIFLLFALSVAIIDVKLYRYWGFRLDHTAFTYIDTPKEMLASLSIWSILSQVTVGIVLFSLSLLAYKKYVSSIIKHIRSGNLITTGIILFLTAFLIIPVRGGFGIAPLNVGMVYFSEEPFLNHAAINVHWNLGYSYANLSDLENHYKVVTDDEAENLVKKLNSSSGEHEKLLITQNPNILLITLESFTAKVIGAMGDTTGATPNFDNFIEEGILFDNFFATGDRTDKGIVGILSGYPSQPSKSIIKYTGKNSKLPSLIQEMNENGYYTSFFYGGTIDFANFRSYLVNSGFNKMVTIDDFAQEYRTSKWGVHDHLLFEKALEEINSSKKPFFSVILTLSSHEPFDVPMETVIEGGDEERKFYNSVFYTDKCLGEFINFSKKQSWWKNTLVILVSDHGARNPGNSPVYALEKFRIPMVWFGGAVDYKDRIICKYGSQTDIPQTLLNQLNIKKKYPFSKDLLDSRSHSFAFYTFNDGWGFVTDSLTRVFDNINRQLIIETGEGMPNSPLTGSIYLQHTYQDFLNK